MNKRQRKKWLKQHNKYINPKETWSLDWTIANFVYPRLKLFKKLNNGHPTNLSMEEWDEILDKMIFSFEELKKDFVVCKDEQKIQEGLGLFAKYYRELWW